MTFPIGIETVKQRHSGVAQQFRPAHFAEVEKMTRDAGLYLVPQIEQVAGP